MTRTPDPILQLYLGRVVGEHARADITAVWRYDSWAELPLDSTLAPRPLPQGAAVLVGVKSRLMVPAHEVYVAVMDGTKEAIALQLTAELVKVLQGFRGR